MGWGTEVVEKVVEHLHLHSVVIQLALLLRLLEELQLFELPGVHRVQMVGNRFHLQCIVLRFVDLKQEITKRIIYWALIILYFRLWYVLPIVFTIGLLASRVLSR